MMEQIGFIINIMQERKPDFIDNLRNDWKGHIILGAYIVNPIVFIIMMLIFRYLIPTTDFTSFHINFNQPIWGARLAIIPCAVCHWIIELSQERTGTGQKEKSDAIAGTSSAVIFYALIEIFYQLN